MQAVKQQIISPGLSWLYSGVVCLILMLSSVTVFAESPPVGSEATFVPTQVEQEEKRMAATRSAQPDPEAVVSIPALNTPVIDLAQVLKPDEKQALSQKIKSIYDQGKAQIAIVIVPSTGQESIFDFAMRIAEKGQWGSAKQDNGLLITVAVNDHRVNISTGYGLEGVLPDILANQIIREQITPAFKQQAYAQGLMAALNQIEVRLNQDPETAQKAAEELKQRQQDALQAQASRERSLNTAIVIFIIAAFASMFVGRGVSAATAGVTGFAAGLFNGAGLLTSVLMGGVLFALLVTPLAQLILQALLSGGGRGGGGRGGGGGGSYGGGGGRFGGGGASGSW